MPKGVRNKDESADLRRRLKVVAESYSQSELARRTGVSKANVHRYLRAGRIPADFVQRVMLEFGLNPSWLMLGRGEMLESEVSDQAVEESNQLLELVVKLNAVGHQRLGAMQGKESARMVRELGDALTRHEELLQKLVERVRPVYLKLLNEYRVLIGEHRHEETSELLPALRQLVRLTQSPGMQANVDMLEAVQCYFKGDLTRQRELQRSALAMLIRAGRLRDAQFMRLVYNTCVGLASAGRLKESARLGNAVFHLSGAEALQWTEDWLLLVPQAILDMQDGNLGRGLHELARVIGACGGEIADGLSDALTFGGCLAGMIPFDDTVKRWSRIAVGSPPLLLAGFWFRDADALRRVRRSRVNLQGNLDARSRRLLEFVDAMLEDRSPPPIDTTEPAHRLELLVATTEAHLRAGRQRDAKPAFQQAKEAMQGLEPDFLPDMLVRATHMRAALELGDAETARQFIRQSLAQGYGFLTTLAEQVGIQIAQPGSAAVPH